MAAKKKRAARVFKNARRRHEKSLNSFPLIPKEMTLTEFCHPRSTKPVCKFQTVIPQQQPPPLMPTHTHTALTRHGNRKNNNNRPESARSCMKWRNCYLSAAAAPTSNSDQSQFRTNEMQVLSSGTLESHGAAAPRHSLWPTFQINWHS